MTFNIEFTDVAEMEVQEIFLWLLGRAPELAGQWQAGLERVVDSLRELPLRCPEAPESHAFEAEVRQILYRPYRVLFTLIDADGDGTTDTVRILHVRHGARLRPGETAEQATE